MRTVQDLMNLIQREPKNWWIKIVPDSEPNADGEWVNCGVHAFPEKMSWRETANRLFQHVPKNHHMVAVSTNDPTKKEHLHG